MQEQLEESRSQMQIQEQIVPEIMRLVVCIERKKFNLFKAICAKNGITMSDKIRELLDKFLES